MVEYLYIPVICLTIGIFIGYYIRDNFGRRDQLINQNNKFKKNSGGTSDIDLLVLDKAENKPKRKFLGFLRKKQPL